MMAIIMFAAATVAECKHVPIERMVERYASMVRHQQGASIAKLFGADGEIDNPGTEPIRGETAIRKLLDSFKGAVVNSEVLTIADVDRDEDDWRVKGHFHQTGRTPAGKDYDVNGSFDSTWMCGADGWRVRRMATGK